MPIHDGEVEPDPDPFGSERIDELAHNIASEPGICDLVVSGLGVPHAESFMMLRRENRISHSCGLCGLRPFPGA